MSWMFPYLRQGAPQWRQTLVGLGNDTFHRSGCLVVALTQIARHLGVADRDYLPTDLNNDGKARGAFYGSGAIIPSLALCAGLQSPSAMRVNAEAGAKAMTDCLLATLEAGWCALVQVDHDSSKPGGDEAGDHWIAALASRAGEVICADPATGRVVQLDPVMLRGLAEWPSGVRLYEVRAVVPVGPAKRPLVA